MQLNGLKVNFLGDSITEGYAASDMQNKSYWGLLRERDQVDARCYGIAGTRIAQRVLPSPGSDEYEHPFAERIPQMKKDADVVLVFGGTNDYGHGDAPIGTYTDSTATTFCGAVRDLCEKLQAAFPDSKIAFLTPLHREFEEGIQGCNEFGEPQQAPLSAYVQVIRQMASEYDLPVLDLYSECKIDPRSPELKHRYTADGLHPNDEGHEVVYRMVREFLLKL